MQTKTNAHLHEPRTTLTPSYRARRGRYSLAFSAPFERGLFCSYADPREYVSSNYNRFDAIILGVSVVQMIQATISIGGQDTAYFKVGKVVLARLARDFRRAYIARAACARLSALLNAALLTSTGGWRFHV